MELSIFDVIGNGVGNVEISEVVKNKLKEKYQEEFIVKKIGNRYGTSTDDNVKTYCCPKNNKELIFTATLNKEQTILEDGYPIRGVAFQLEEYIKNKFKDKEIDVIVKCDIIGKNKLNEFLSLQQFIEQFKGVSFLTYIISKNVIEEDILRDVYNEIEEKYKDIYLKTIIYMLNEDGFKKCDIIASDSPTITDSIIEKYIIMDEKIIKIFEGKIYRIK